MKTWTHFTAICEWWRLAIGLAVAFLGCGFLSGCAALTNPVAVGQPVREISPDLRGDSREGQQTIPLNWLRQKPPEAYRLAAADVLGLYIEGVLGEKDQSPPVNFPEAANAPPALGFPVPVRGDGTLPLPLISPLRVDGMTLAEAEDAIRKAYTQTQRIIRPDARVIVTLQRPRRYHILVMRQDAATTGTTVNVSTFGNNGSELISRANEHGTGFEVDLPAYENDVLTALARTGGLPGLDAIDDILIERTSSGGEADQAASIKQNFETCLRGNATVGFGGRIIRIPIRFKPGEEQAFRPEDIILQNGDIIFIESRKLGVFYTGGLLPAGEHILPLDFDLDVIEAVARVRGPLVNGGVSTSNLSGSIVGVGIGSPSPSLLTVLRKTHGGGRVPIRVELNRAMRDPAESLVVQSGDILILQEKPSEALTRYATEVIKFDFLFTLFQSKNATGTSSIIVP